MVVTGDPIAAERAHQFGFVNLLTNNGGAFDGALRLAERVTANAPIAVTESAVVVRTGSRVDQASAWELSAAAGRVTSKSADFAEGPRAFAEKRTPRWTGKMREKWQKDYDSGALFDSELAEVRKRGTAVPAALRAQLRSSKL